MQHKRKLSVILMLAFILTMVVPVSAFAAGFSDVPSNHWAIQQIDRMNARGIIGGYEDGTARPNNPVTQFEAITMATRMMGLQYDESQNKGTYLPFKYPDWTGAYGVAVIAYEAGLVDASDFNHSSAASREWIAKLLIKVMEVESELNSVSDETLSFNDTSSIGSDYLNYVKLAYDKGLIGGYTDGSFKPKNTVTRAEMAAFLCRVEDKLNTTVDNVVKGKVTNVTGVNVTIDGVDGKSYNLFATTNSILYNKSSQKIGVTGLAIGDSVYAVYKNSLLNYLEVRSEEYNTNNSQVITNLSGTINAVIGAKNTIVVSDEDGALHTVIVDKNTKINKEDSNIALAFSDLLTDMSVRISVDKDDQTANQIIIEETTDGQKGGTIYSVDVYDNLIVMNEKTGLKSYRMSKNIEVSISGMLSATPSSLKEGDMATYTISDGVMVAIAVGGSTDAYGGNAKVKSIDTVNRIINYQTSSNELKAAFYNSGQVVKFKNGDTGTMSDLQVGDGINITVDDNQVTAITVTSRNLSEGAIKGTVFSVNTTDEYIVITTSNGSKETYDLASNVKVSLYGDSASLGRLNKGMKVELTLQNNEVIRIKANDLVDGVVKNVNSSARTIQVTTDSGTEIYDVASDVDINFYRTSSSRLSALDVGDTVSMKVVNDEVTIINVNEQVDMTVYSLTYSNDYIRLEDENGNRISEYLDDVELIIDGVHSSDIDDLSIGDEVVATFAGSELIKIEVASQVKSGEVTKVNTSTNTITVKTFSNDIKTVQFNNGSYVVKNGSSSSNISTVKVGDRISVSSGSNNSRVITVMNSRTGDVQYVIGDRIQFLTESGQSNSLSANSYTAVNGCYCHYKNSTSQFVLDNSYVTRGDSITIYYTDRDSVYEVVKN